jgi:hypothetical protein
MFVAQLMHHFGGLGAVTEVLSQAYPSRPIPVTSSVQVEQLPNHSMMCHGAPYNPSWGTI